VGSRLRQSSYNVRVMVAVFTAHGFNTERSFAGSWKLVQPEVA